MAQELVDGEFWLPPEFLNDDDILMDFGKPINNGTLSGGFSSPVDSVFGSNETESDEEEYLTELTHKFSNTTLKENFWELDTKYLNSENTQFKPGTVMAGSPQSTLCGCKNGSNIGNPNCVSPPPTASPKENQPSFDLLYAAAGEIARMRMIEEAASRYSNNLNKNHHIQQSARKTIKNPNLHYQQLQLAQFEHLKQQQIAKQQYLQMMVQRARNGSGNNRPVAPVTPTWTGQQNQNRSPGSDMRAVFLRNPKTKRESTGTGVFLPRQPGAPTEPYKKRGCSTVLLPDRVVQALDLKLEAIGGADSKVQSRCNGGSLASDYKAEMMYRKSLLMAQQKRNNQRQ